MKKNPEDFVLPLLRKVFLESVADFEKEVKIRTPVDTGRLRNSIHIESIKTEGDMWEGEVGTDVEYASFVEYGTSKMAARAMFRQGKLIVASRMRARVKRALKKGIQEYLKR